MRRYQIVAIYPEGEQPSFHVIDHALEIEAAILPTVEEAYRFRQLREYVDGYPQQLQISGK